MKQEFPEWIRRPWGAGSQFTSTRELIEDLGLHTVCQSAHCPNQGECWRNRTATLMILGSICSRDCAFCSVRSGHPQDLDAEEPARVAEAVRRLELKHAVITSVTRDDLPDGGAAHFAQTIQAIREANPETSVEVLVPDFQGEVDPIETVLAARPDVFGHNIETVARLYPDLRSPRASYETALSVLAVAADSPPPLLVKSGIMVGHGETEQEVEQTLADVYAAGCRAVTLGQYLRPTKAQRRVAEFVHPDRFKTYEQMARAMGFHSVLAGPFVRSSYLAETVLEQSMHALGNAQANCHNKTSPYAS